MTGEPQVPAPGARTDGDAAERADAPGARARLRRLLHRRSIRLLLLLLIVAAGTFAWLRLAPLPSGLLDLAAAESTVVVDRHGTPLYEALSGDGTRTARLTADTIPDLVAAATVAAEDRRFWSHYGVDPLAIARAARRNLVEGAIAEGGSTITQQVAKLLLLRTGAAERRGWKAKLVEARLALALEHRMSKRELLAMYLNLASYGNQITGFERASQTYFGTPSRMLTPAQAAFLAGLPQRPSSFNPYRSLTLARSRQAVVLRRMVAAGSLSEQDAAGASGEQLRLTRADRPFLAPHFVEMAIAEAGAGRPSQIRTTLDAGLQAEVAGIIRTHREALDRHGAANVAVVVLDNARAEWLAWEGSGNYFDAAHGGSINGPVSPRQPGSALKPFTYALGFEQGYTPASVLPDVPMNFPTAQDGVVYSPRNYDGQYRGPLLARAALAGSENVPAVSLASEIGVPGLLRFLRRAGFSTFDKNAAHYGLGLTLGNAEVRLDELVAAYAAFARGGEWIAPTWLADDPRDRERRPLVSRTTAFWITDILSDPDARAYIFGRGGSLDFPFPVAAKTGTSQAYHDNWTIGYTQGVTVGVWVGNFDRRPLRNSSGVTGAAPIFQAVMLAAHGHHGGDERPVATPTRTLTERTICSLSGEAATRTCPATRREWLPSGAEAVPCSWHHPAGDGSMVVWPPQYREWARRSGSDVQPAPAVGPVRLARANGRPRQRRAASRPLEIANPPSGATYLIDPTLRREFQTLQLRAISPGPTRIEWSINGVPFSSGTSEAAVEWPLRTGRHTITARDPLGNTVQSTVTVR